MRKLSLTTILVAFATAASPAFAQNKRATLADADGNPALRLIIRTITHQREGRCR